MQRKEWSYKSIWPYSKVTVKENNDSDRNSGSRFEYCFIDLDPRVNGKTCSADAVWSAKGATEHRLYNTRDEPWTHVRNVAGQVHERIIRVRVRDYYYDTILYRCRVSLTFHVLRITYISVFTNILYTSTPLTANEDNRRCLAWRKKGRGIERLSPISREDLRF